MILNKLKKEEKMKSIKSLISESNFLKGFKSYISSGTLHFSSKRRYAEDDVTIQEVETRVSRRMLNLIISLVDEEIKRVDNDISEMIK